MGELKKAVPISDVAGMTVQTGVNAKEKAEEV